MFPWGTTLHDHITKRSISFADISKFAQTLYDVCDFDCIKKFDFGIERLLRSEKKIH